MELGAKGQVHALSKARWEIHGAVVNIRIRLQRVPVLLRKLGVALVVVQYNLIMRPDKVDVGFSDHRGRGFSRPVEQRGQGILSAHPNTGPCLLIVRRISSKLLATVPGNIGDIAVVDSIGHRLLGPVGVGVCTEVTIDLNSKPLGSFAMSTTYAVSQAHTMYGSGPLPNVHGGVVTVVAVDYTITIDLSTTVSDARAIGVGRMVRASLAIHARAPARVRDTISIGVEVDYGGNVAVLGQKIQ